MIYIDTHYDMTIIKYMYPMI